MVAVGPLRLSGVATPMRYKVRLVNWKGATLFTGSIAAVPAP